MSFAAIGSIELAGIMLPEKGALVKGLMRVFGSWEKLPVFSAEVGMVLTALWPCRILVRSQSPKMKVLFLMIGPPAANPYWLRWYCGLVTAKKFLASASLLRRNS